MADGTPKKQHAIEYIAIGALVAAALIVAIMRFKKGDINDEVFSRKEFNEKWKEIEIIEAKAPKNEKEVTAYTIENEKFPFRSPFDEILENKGLEDEGITLPQMQFQGMVWKGSRPQAIINNKVYDVNDVVELNTGEAEGEVKVKGVNKEGIHLIYKGKEFIVRPK